MKSKKKITVVMPALNEEPTIGPLVKGVMKNTDEVIVVDDGSTDRTGEIAEKNGATVLRQESNTGYDRAISAGFKMAESTGADIILTFDADGQHEASDIPRMVRPIIEGKADIVVGVRPRVFRLAERLFKIYSKRAIGVADPFCGMKAYSVDVYREVGYFDRMDSIGTQLMFEAEKRDFRIAQIGIKLNLRRDEPRFGRRVKANIKIFTAMLKIMVSRKFK